MADEVKASEAIEKKVYKASAPKQYQLTSRMNRTYELHIRKSVYIFPPNGTQIVGESVINSPDFLQQQDKFIIKEVN